GVSLSLSPVTRRPPPSPRFPYTTLFRSRQWLADNTNSEGFSGTLKEALVNADVFIGVSAPDLLDGADIATMNDDAIVFAMANTIASSFIVAISAPSKRSGADTPIITFAFTNASVRVPEKPSLLVLSATQ